MKYLTIVTVSLLLGSIQAVIYEKRCLIFEESYNFDESRYAGKWFEIRRLYDPNVIELEDCVQEQYTRAEDRLDFGILRAAQEGPTGEVVYSTGTATPKVFHNSKVPQFIVRYNTTDPADPDTAMDIVQTDYLNYAIVYSCNPINTTMVSESAWVISRDPVLKKHTADMINKFVDEHFNHPEHKWRITEQSAKICKPNILPSSAAVQISLVNSLLHVCVALVVIKMIM